MAQVGAFLLIQLVHVATHRMKRFAVKAVTEMGEAFWDDRRVAFLKGQSRREGFPGISSVHPLRDLTATRAGDW